MKLPPLRKRRDDIALLANHFLERLTAWASWFGFEDSVMETFLKYEWPGM
jgi:transcriptional regulator with GAF, ATPase, and Fis domain